MNNMEKIIKILNKKYSTSKTNKISINKEDFSDINVPQSEITRTLCLMDSGNFIKITRKSKQDTLDISWDIDVLPPCVDYFNNKKQEKKNNRNYWIQFWIPVSLSVAAIVISIIALF